MHIEGPRFTAEEERDMVVRMRAGDLHARHALVLSVCALATSIAARFGDEGFRRRVDVVSEAYFEVCRCLDGFDPDKGRLTTFVSRSVGMRLAKLRQLGGFVIRPTCRAAWKASVGVDDDEARLASAVRRTGYLPEDFEVAARAEEPGHDEAIAEELERAIGMLTPRQAEVIRRRYLSGEVRSQSRVAAEVGKSERNIQKREQLALDRLAELLGGAA